MAFSLTTRGSCQAEDANTLSIFKSIQRETNRILDVQNKELLFVDGKIGVKTLAAINGIKMYVPVTGVLGANFSSCSDVVRQADAILRAISTAANNLKAPVVADPKSIVRAIISPPDEVDVTTGKVIHGSPVTSKIGGIPLWAIALVGGGGAYFILKRGKGKGKGKGKRRFKLKRGKSSRQENLLGGF